MDPALGLSKRNCLQRRERRPSPPVAHDCKDPLELGPCRETSCTVPLKNMNGPGRGWPGDNPVHSMQEGQCAMMQCRHDASQNNGRDDVSRIAHVAECITPTSRHNTAFLGQYRCLSCQQIIALSMPPPTTTIAATIGNQSSSSDGVVSPSGRVKTGGCKSDTVTHSQLSKPKRGECLYGSDEKFVLIN